MPVSGFVEKLALVPALPALIKWGKVTMAEFAARLRDPFLHRAFPVIQYDFADLPMLIHLNFIVGCHNRLLGWPVGGSRAFAQSIADRSEQLGAKLLYRSRVSKVLVDADRAVGIQLEDGTQVSADRVISAADGHTTIFEMLDGKYVNDFIRGYFAEPDDRQDMNFHVSLGVSRDMEGEPNALTMFLERPVELLGRQRDRLNVEIFNFDRTLAPAGKCAVKVLLDSSYSRWRGLYDDRERYEEEKQAVADQVIELLESRFAGLSEAVEVVDVATPVTVERFTGNWRGMQAGFPEGASMLAMMRGWLPSLPGLDRFYMVGHWAGGIGISTAALSGRNAVKSICREDRRRFVTDGL
jgi:phytoene dehydrogenase-like protein